ncbi:MAG TPA: EamA family transporter [Terriglobales bacterium]|nr:EamA family transporter [Terriglobales bacterium]
MAKVQESAAQPPYWQILLAFGIIYFVWGSTFFAISVGVHEVPPLLLADMRFFVSGIVLYVWLLLRGEPSPTLREWGSASMVATLVFVMDYGCLFWAEQRVPSGIAAVILATIPVFIALMEILILRTQKLTARLGLALLIGIGGVAILMNHSFSAGEAPISRAGAAALLFAAFTWSIATVLTKKLPLPASKPMSSAVQMLSGGVQLMVISAIFGEFSGFHAGAVSSKAWLALAYLIVFGSIIGYTAYIWLLHHKSPTLVGTYAYVNPVVAVILGYFAGGETIGARTAAGILLVLVSVITITTAPKLVKEPEHAKHEPALSEAS